MDEPLDVVTEYTYSVYTRIRAEKLESCQENAWSRRLWHDIGYVVTRETTTSICATLPTLHECTNLLGAPIDIVTEFTYSAYPLALRDYDESIYTCVGLLGSFRDKFNANSPEMDHRCALCRRNLHIAAELVENMMQGINDVFGVFVCKGDPECKEWLGDAFNIVSPLATMAYNNITRNIACEDTKNCKKKSPFCGKDKQPSA